MSDRLVVIGGDAAGMSGASQARRLKDPNDLEIIAFEKGNFTSYSACGIPYTIGGVVGDFDELVVRRPEEFRDKYSIDARIRQEVLAIDLEGRKVTVRDLDGGREYTEGFDLLLVATGAKPIKPPLPGVNSRGVFGVQTLDDGMAIEKFVAEESPGRGVVVGGGYIGLEMAEALVARGLKVTVVELAPQPMSKLDPDMGEWVGEKMRAMGIDLLTSEPVTAFEDEGGRVKSVVTESRNLPADVVVLGLGVKANADLADEAGIAVGSAGGVEVNQQMETSAPGVWAAGDCAEKFHRITHKPVVIPLGTHANKEGRVAGMNIGGAYATFPGVIGTAVSKVCDLEVARTGLQEQEAEELGFEYIASTVDSTTRAGYFPGSSPIKIKLIVEINSGRLLGAQIVGEEGAAKRIDVLATAIWNEMKVADMLNMDLSYAPPFAPVWDPVLIAARKAWEKLEAS